MQCFLLHYAFDKWLELTERTIHYARYGDDVIVHCKNEAQAKQMLNAIRERMKTVELELHPGSIAETIAEKEIIR